MIYFCFVEWIEKLVTMAKAWWEGHTWFYRIYYFIAVIWGVMAFSTWFYVSLAEARPFLISWLLFYVPGVFIVTAYERKSNKKEVKSE